MHPGSIKNTHIRARNGSNLGGFMSNSGSKGNLHEFHMTSGGNAFQSLPREAKHGHGKKILKGNSSNLKIPTITLHNQSFLSTKFSPKNDSTNLTLRSNGRSPQNEGGFHRSPNQSSSKNLNRTIYQMPSIGSNQHSARDHSDNNRRRHLNN